MVSVAYGYQRTPAQHLRYLDTVEVEDSSSSGPTMESTPKLAAAEGETAVDEALRELLKGNTEVAITVESIGEVLRRLDTITPVTMVKVAAVNLASFDELCAETAVRQ